MSEETRGAKACVAAQRRGEHRESASVTLLPVCSVERPRVSSYRLNAVIHAVIALLAAAATISAKETDLTPCEFDLCTLGGRS